MEQRNRKKQDVLVFYLNGQKIEERNPKPEYSLLFYLRHERLLCGTKDGCGVGGCGTCTILVSKAQPKSKKILHLAVKACLVPLCWVHGCVVTTIEGIGSVGGGLHPVQERLAKGHGVQCGFCSAGMCMSMYSLLRNKKKPQVKDIEDSISGNLCRCTGYRPILNSFESFSKKKVAPIQQLKEPLEDFDSIKVDGEIDNEEMLKVETESRDDLEVQLDENDSDSDSTFPPELRVKSHLDGELKFGNKSSEAIWYRPTTLSSLLKLKKKYPEAVLVGGSTAPAPAMEQIGKSHKIFIHVTTLIPEMRSLHLDSSHLHVGAAVTFTQLQNYCKGLISKSKSNLNPGNLFAGLIKLLDRVADLQIRNVATIGGSIQANVMTSETTNFFVVAQSSIILQSERQGRRELKLDSNYYKKNGETLIEVDDVIVSLKIPLMDQNEFLWSTKQSRRNDGDFASLGCSIKIKFRNPDAQLIENFHIAFNGFSVGKLFESQKAFKFLMGKNWERVNLKELTHLFLQDFPPSSPDPNISIEYRRALTEGFLLKFHQTLKSWRSSTGKLEDEKQWKLFHQPHFQKATQLYQIKPHGMNPQSNIIGLPVINVSAFKLTTGEGTYTADIPPTQQELFGSFFLSDKASAVIKSIHYEEALQLAGVIAIYDSKSLPQGKNQYTDEVAKFANSIFADGRVDYFGQVIALVVAESLLLAEKGTKLIRIEWEEQESVLTLEEAIEKKAYYQVGQIKSPKGWIDTKVKENEDKDEDEKMKATGTTTRGEFKIGGQKHFYMEPCAFIAKIKDQNQIEIEMTTRKPSEVQRIVADSLNLKYHQVVVKTKRTGGSFGGKDKRATCLSVCVALAAWNLKSNVRCVLTREQDTKLVGGRHPMLCRYEVNYSKSGQINGVKAKIFSNGGLSTNALSTYVLREAMTAFVTTYKIPYWNVRGYVCQTNRTPNGACRGFGSPQGHLMIEHIFDSIIHTLQLDPNQVRIRHFYKDGDETCTGFKIEASSVDKCLSECVKLSDYQKKVEEAEKLNSKNKWRKRGVSLIPIIHPVGVERHLQSGALVMIFPDGTVQVNIGSTEVGQGLTTKIIQIASDVLGIPTENIQVPENSSDKVPNTSGTLGSLSTELNGRAVIDACKILMVRLEPYRKAQPEGKWEDWIMKAYGDCVDLSAIGHNKIISKLLYLTYGAACSEVEVDCLTGDYDLLRTDICMDIGVSINPGIDVGQIEGAFVQGCGLYTMEQVLYDPDGHLLSQTPRNYLIPTVKNIPRNFNVAIVRGTTYPNLIYSGKALGEPPLLLASSVFFAIKEAVRAKRKEKKLEGNFEFYSPAVPESVRLAIGLEGNEISE